MSNSPKTGINQQGSSVEGLQAQGGDESIFNIGNTIQYNYLPQEAEFFKPDLERFKLPEFIGPKQKLVDQWVKTVRDTGLLVLGGGNDIDKASLALYLACYLSENNGNYPSRPVLEWQRSSDPQSIDVKLQQADREGIFVLNQITPQNIAGYNFSSIQTAAKLKDHYVIASTDKPLESWKLSTATEKQSWKNLSSEELYDSEILVQVLIEQLKNSGEGFQKILPSKLATLDLSNSEDLKLIKDPKWLSDLKWFGLEFSQIAKQLAVPDKIDDFIQFLKKEVEDKKLIKASTINQLIKQATDNKSVLHHWYNHLLDLQEQILALGLNFFDGFFVDQFFAALEEVMEKVWRKRDPSLKAMDSGDLANLRNFFSINPTGPDTEEKRIRSRLPRQRLMLFRIAWESHQQKILKALRIIVKLVANSVADRSLQDDQLYDDSLQDDQLYGDYRRRRQLRQILGEAISDLGRISSDAVQDTLLKLAVDREEGVQRVAAFAMARWHDSEDNLDKQLFETLQRWQSNDDKRLVRKINSFFKANSQTEDEDPQTYIRITIIFTIRYAAFYDLPNQLHKELCNLLEELSKDGRPLVCQCFWSNLPRIVQQHPSQLYDLLYRMTRHRGLIGAISDSLKLVYQTRPDEVLATLNRWEQNLSPIQTEKSISRENVLATIVLTYGKLNCDNKNSPLNTIQVFDKLHQILQAETEPFIRRAVISGIGMQLLRHFEELEPKLLEITPEFDTLDCDNVVDALVDIYSDQRKKLENGDKLIEGLMDALETAMARWKANSTKPRAQEIATRVLRNLGLESEQEPEEEPLLPEPEEEPLVQTLQEDDKYVEPRQVFSPTPTIDKTVVGLIGLGGGALLILIGYITVNLVTKKASTIPPQNCAATKECIVLIDAADVKDIDSLDFDTGQLTVELAKNGTSDDHLAIRDLGAGKNKISLQENQILYGNTVIGRFQGNGGTQPLVIQLNGNANPETTRILLSNITYRNSSDRPQAGLRTIEFNLSDGDGGTSNALQRNVNVAGNNIAPSISIPGEQTVKENASLTISKIKIEDPDSSTLTVQLKVSNGTLTVKEDVAQGLKTENIRGNKTKTVTLKDSIDRINTTLAAADAIRYQGQKDFAGQDVLAVRVNDGGDSTINDATIDFVWPPGGQTAKTAIERMSIAINPTGTPPEISIPGQQAVNEDSSLSISGINIKDSDSQTIRVSLNVTNGILTVKDNVGQGLNARDINGNKTKMVTLEGSPDAINRTLADSGAIAYQGNPNFSGSDILEIVASDGKYKDTKTVDISVKPVNDPPTISIAKRIKTIVKPKEAEEEDRCRKVACPHTDKIPVGEYSYDEKGFSKTVSYSRKGNLMVGALYDNQQPDNYTCFAASIGNTQVNIDWWRNLSNINKTGQNRFTTSYSILNFTVDNVRPFRKGLENSAAVRQCQNEQKQ